MYQNNQGCRVSVNGIGSVSNNEVCRKSVNEVVYQIVKYAGCTSTFKYAEYY